MYEKPNPHSIDFNPEDSQDVVLFNKNDEYKIQHVLNGTYKNLNEEQKKRINEYIYKNTLYYNLKWKYKNKAFDIYD